MPPGGAALPNNSLKSASTLQRTSQSIFITMICHKQYHDLSPCPPGSIIALCPTCHTFPLCFSATWRALNTTGNRKKSPRLHLWLGGFGSKAEFKNKHQRRERARRQPVSRLKKPLQTRTWRAEMVEMDSSNSKWCKKKKKRKVRTKQKVRETFRPARLSSLLHLSYLISF